MRKSLKWGSERKGVSIKIIYKMIEMRQNDWKNPQHHLTLYEQTI